MTSHADPALVTGRHVFDAAPIPRFDDPELEGPATRTFGAGQEKRDRAIPPDTSVRSADPVDHRSRPPKRPAPCARRGTAGTYLDEIVVDDASTRRLRCSDAD